jgi:ferredoxin
MRYLEGVVTLALDKTRCNGCGMCVAVCPHAVFRLEQKRATLADREACMECGACARNCESGAIRVRAGVGCAAGVLAGLLKGTEPTCDCSQQPTGCC